MPDFLGIKPTASQADIIKAGRRVSKKIHPDKARRTFISEYMARHVTGNKSNRRGPRTSKGPSEREIKAAVKKATQRYARLSLVRKILEGPNRARYDHFLANGFPRWKGTDYYYSRFRPGLGSVLIGLFLVVGGGAHYATLILSWKRQRAFVQRYIREARRAAWGDESGIPGLANIGTGVSTSTSSPPAADDGTIAVNRRQKRMMDRESRKDNRRGKNEEASEEPAPPPAPTASGPQGPRKRVVAENGKVLIVDAMGNVFLEDETEDGTTEEFLLDIDEIPKPTLKDTALYRLPRAALCKMVGKLLKRPEVEVVEVEEVVDEEIVDTPVEDEGRRNGASKKRRGKRS